MFKHKLILAAIFWSACSVRADEFILSYWCGPPPSSNIDERYTEVAECGFNYAMVADERSRF